VGPREGRDNEKGRDGVRKEGRRKGEGKEGKLHPHGSFYKSVPMAINAQ